MDFESYETRRAAWLTANGYLPGSVRDINGRACALFAGHVRVNQPGRFLGMPLAEAKRRAQRTASAPASCPMASFVRSRLVAAAGGRVALRTVWTLWQAERAASGHDSGARAELVVALRVAFPAARLVRARSGVDVVPGRHVLGVVLK